MIIEFMLVKSAKNPLGTPQKVETFEDFARIVQNARNARENDPKDGPAICAPMKDNKRKDVNVLPRNWVAIEESNRSGTSRARSIHRREPIA